jgi:phosphoketolase
MSNDRAMDAQYHATLSSDELRRIDAWWRACNYLSVGMIYNLYVLDALAHRLFKGQNILPHILPLPRRPLPKAKHAPD